MIFLITMPKSGTMWLSQLLRDATGYPVVGVRHDDNYDIIEMPKGDVVARSHIRPSEHNFKRVGSQKSVILYRDLEEVAESRYRWIKTRPGSPHSELYNVLPKEEAIEHSYQYVKRQYFPWLIKWLKHAKRNKQFKTITYKGLKKSPRQTILDILRFYRIKPDLDKVAFAVVNPEKPVTYLR